MVWLYLIILLAIIIGVGIVFEKKGRNKMDDADITTEEKEALNEDYIKKGNTNETDDTDKL